MTIEPTDPRDALVLDPEARERLDHYLAKLLEENQTHNLLSRHLAEPDVARGTLEIPSYAIGRVWGERAAPAAAMDIGSGNGYPGIVLAAAWPDARVLLVERRQKKAAAIARCASAADFGNVRVIATDAREIPAHHKELVGVVDLVTARGVGSLAEVTHLALPFLAPGGLVVHWKALATSDEELAAGEAYASAQGLSVMGEWRFAPVPPGPGRLIAYQRGGRD